MTAVPWLHGVIVEITWEALARARRRSTSSARGGAVDEDGNAAMVEIPYLEKMRWVCKDLGYEEEYADIVGSRLLGLEGADYNTTTVNGEVPTLDTVVEFLAQAFLRFTLHAGVVLVTADDIHWMVSAVVFDICIGLSIIAFSSC